jgi:hypothetical protein
VPDQRTLRDQRISYDLGSGTARGCGGYHTVTGIETSAHDLRSLQHGHPRVVASSPRRAAGRRFAPHSGALPPRQSS